MADDDLRRALERAAAAAPPMSLDVTRQLALGARRRRARRWGASVAVVVSVAALGVGGAAAVDLVHRPAGPAVVGPATEGPATEGRPIGRWPVGGDATAVPPAPEPTPGWYSTDLDELFVEHPDEWGGAYYDGETLVVKAVSRPAPDAAAYLQALGVPADTVVEQAGPAISDYVRVADALTADEQLALQVVNVEADYGAGGLLITARADADREAVTRRISDVVEATGSTIPVLAVRWEG